MLKIGGHLKVTDKQKKVKLGQVVETSDTSRRETEASLPE